MAGNLINYKFQFPITAAVSSRLLYLRIKSVDNDGSFKYSTTTTLNAECTGKNTLTIYPNPVGNHQQYVIVNTSGSALNGKYKASLHDVTGRLISITTFSFSNQQQFDYPLDNIAAGQYLLRITNTTNGETSTLKFQRL